MITVKNLHKKYAGNHVLRGVNYHVDQGEKIVVIGPSGSGKSTFLRCLNLLETPTSGEIWFDGQLITDKKTDINKVRQHMGMVFQNFNLFNNLTIMDNIILGSHQAKADGNGGSKGKCPAAFGQSRTTGKGRFVSKLSKWWSEAENRHCQIPCHESQSDAF